MKQFFKFTFFKLILALIIAILPLVGGLLYNNRSIVPENETLRIEASWGVEALYYVSNILLLPLRFITAPFWKLFGEDYFRSISGKELPPSFFYIDWSLAFIFFLFLFIESYFLSCLISFLVNKISTRYKR